MLTHIFLKSEGGIYVTDETIMLIETDAQTRELLATYLEKNNYRIIEAQDGQEALIKLTTIKPTLIILNIKMPKINGFEVCRKVRRNRKLKDVPIIFLSRLCDPETITSALELGGDDYITKPFHPNEVVARIRAVLRRVTLKTTSCTNENHYEDLTAQEMNIINLIEKGFTNREIARSLGLTEGTVKVYSHTIYQKLHVKNRTQALVRAKELQLI